MTRKPSSELRTPQRDVPTKAYCVLCKDRISFFTVPLPQRKTLPHEIPSWVNPEREVYFVTINCHDRTTNQLALPGVSERVFGAVRFRQRSGLWWPHLFLLMPDHLHALISFPLSDKSARVIVSKWKEWVAKDIGIIWQRGFFEHRLRRDESFQAKSDYIQRNPVRKDLVANPDEWPFVYFGLRG
jgi:REP element-mobilizing transposase RayT